MQDLSEDISIVDKTMYLLEQKYPNAQRIFIAMNRPSIHSEESWKLYQTEPRSPYDLERERCWTEIQNHFAELKALPVEEIEALYREAIKEEENRQKEEAEEAEQKRFYNQLNAYADLAYWAKMDYWQLEEAMALVLERDPQIVTWDEIKSYIRVSPFVQAYAHIRELVRRARQAGYLTHMTTPIDFMEWAKNKGMNLPDELEHLIIQQSNAPDWEEKFHNLEKQNNKLVKENGILKKKLEEALEKTKPNTTERNSMLKIIHGIGKSRYGYNPAVARNEATSKIKGALENVGISMDEATILKYLREGAQLSED